jgi:hypothetical protein
MQRSNGRALRPLLLFAGSVLLGACDQPLVVHSAPAPGVDAQVAGAATVAGVRDPADLARARTALDGLIVTWRSPTAAALHADARRAHHNAALLAAALSHRSAPRLQEVENDAMRAAAARSADPPHP